ncbi:MAG: Phosphonoacetaldehyde hydrolase [Luteibacter sp.]|uniref:phosphonoacetaldehyde hydrolase n=1 Tax=Luteibacter sp. TaxID=1886636 RepID=UPI0013849D66|nr:phosphonoacetaldehyde hydrolase [Luteibacter sp.]KAF1005972.1 MAG: Phosphonoacetaldehyde hydrolase [Luteibacter sp.]
MNLLSHPGTVVPSPSYRGPVAAAIFDWAGTVLDFGCMAPVEAFREVFEEAGVPISEAEARAPMGAAKREHIALILAMSDVEARWVAMFGSKPDEEEVDRLYAHFLRVDEAHVTRHGAMIPKALETMAALRSRGIRIGSTTGYPREVMTKLLPLAASQGYVPDHCCTVSDVSRGRPWPDMCLANAMALQVPDVRACVVVDDSPSGLVSGRAAGMWVIGIAASGNEMGLSLDDWNQLAADERTARLAPIRERLERAGAHYVIDSVADLLPAIDAIEALLADGVTP